MDEKTADAVTDFLIENYAKTLYIAWLGGEPLLVCDIIDRITSRIKASGIELESLEATMASYRREEDDEGHQ